MKEKKTIGMLVSKTHNTIDPNINIFLFFILEHWIQKVIKRQMKQLFDIKFIKKKNNNITVSDITKQDKT